MTLNNRKSQTSSGNGVIAQYYNLLRLGKSGYRHIVRNCHDTATYLSNQIEALGKFELLSKGQDLPVFSFRLKKEITSFSLYDLAEKLRTEGWQVPVYTMPPDIEDMVVMRLVIKENFSRDMADLLIASIKRQLQLLMTDLKDNSPPKRQSFHH